MMTVAVIIVNYNGERWLTRCLDSLRGTIGVDRRIIVVDNGSTDRSVEIVRENFPEVELLCAGENLGFCEGNNRGIGQALAGGAELVALLNPDTWVEPDWLRELVAVLESEAAPGIVGAVQLGYDDDRFNSWTMTAVPQHLAELEDVGRARRWIPVDWVEGACLLISRQVLDEIGWLDPLFFAFYEEIDLCRRARAHGYRVGLVPRSRIHHYRGGSWQATPARQRERDRRCDRSQFIYVLSDPARGRVANLVAGLWTLVTKLKEAVVARSGRKVVDLLSVQVEVWRAWPAIERKWATDRERHRQMARSKEYRSGDR